MKVKFIYVLFLFCLSLVSVWASSVDVFITTEASDSAVPSAVSSSLPWTNIVVALLLVLLVIVLLVSYFKKKRLETKKKMKKKSNKKKSNKKSNKK